MRRYEGGILYAALPLHMQRGCFRIRTHDQQVTKAQLYRCTRMWIKGLVLGRWMDGGWVSLKEKYPRLYQISQQQNQHIQQMGTIAYTIWEWKLQWRRFLEVEIDTAAKFMEDLQHLTVNV